MLFSLNVVFSSCKEIYIVFSSTEDEEGKPQQYFHSQEQQAGFGQAGSKPAVLHSFLRVPQRDSRPNPGAYRLAA